MFVIFSLLLAMPFLNWNANSYALGVSCYQKEGDLNLRQVAIIFLTLLFHKNTTATVAINLLNLHADSQLFWVAHDNGRK